MRSKSKQDEWQNQLRGRQILLDGSLPVEKNLEIFFPSESPGHFPGKIKKVSPHLAKPFAFGLNFYKLKDPN